MTTAQKIKANRANAQAVQAQERGKVKSAQHRMPAAMGSAYQS